MLSVVVAAALGVLTNVATSSPTVALVIGLGVLVAAEIGPRSGRTAARANRAAMVGPIHRMCRPTRVSCDD